MPTSSDLPHSDDVVFSPAERPICEVQPDPDSDEWWPGEVRAIIRQDDGRWLINANWTVRHVNTHLRNLPARQVRKSADDGRYGADR